MERDIKTFMSIVTSDVVDEMRPFLMERHKIDEIKHARAIKRVWALLDSLHRSVIRPEIDIERLPDSLLQHERDQKPSMQQQERKVAKKGRPNDDQSYDAEAQIIIMDAQQARQTKKASKLKQRRERKNERKQVKRHH